MKAKKLLVIATSGAIFFAGCSANAVGASQSSVSAMASSGLEEDAPQEEKPPRQRERNENGVVGKITVVSEAEITLELASMERPDADDRNFGGDDGQPPERQERDGFEPSGKPDGESGDSMPEPLSEDMRASGRGSGGGMAFSFTGETAAYTFADKVSIQKSMGGNEEALDVSDLKAGDMVRVEPDDDGKAAAVFIMNDGTGGQPPEMPAEEN